MSLDDVHERARVLERELGHFNERLRAAFEEEAHAHASVSPLWDDAMRRDYDTRWQPLAESMQDYVHRVGPRYVEFLAERLRHLQAYLHGHGT